MECSSMLESFPSGRQRPAPGRQSRHRPRVRAAVPRQPRVGHVVATCRGPRRHRTGRVGSTASGRLSVLALDVTDERRSPPRSRRTHRRSHVCTWSSIAQACCTMQRCTCGPRNASLTCNAAALARAFAVNAIGPLLVARHCEPLLAHAERAVFASLSARVGSIEDNRLGGWYAYRGSKAAQNMFTRTLAIEWARSRRNVICVALHPGTTDTDLSAPSRPTCRLTGCSPRSTPSPNCCA